MTPRQAAALAAIAVAWGASFLFIRVLRDAGIEPLGISAGRTVLGAMTLLPVAWLQRDSFPRERRVLAWLVGLGVVNFAVPWTLFGVGAGYVPSGVSSIANASTPLWTAIASAALISSDGLGRTRAFGLLLGFAGVVVLMEGRVTGLDRDSLFGIPVMLVATMCYAISTVAIRRWVRDVPALPLAAGQIAVAAALLTPAALATGAYSGAEAGWHEWLSLVVLGMVGSGVIVVLYMWLIGEVGAVRASVVTYLMPPIGLFLGWLLLDEGLSWSTFAGLVLIVAGIAVVQGLIRPGVRRSREALSNA